MSEKFSMKKFLREHRRDAVLLLSLILIAVAALLAVLLITDSGDLVKVELDGVEVAKYPLGKDGEYAIGDGNTLVIENGEAYMKYADCPDGTCVRTGRISKRGQTIICLPNRVAVTVITDSDGPDMVS